MIDANLPGGTRMAVTSIAPDASTRGVIIFDISPPLVLPAVSGEVALAGEATIRQRVLQGGSRVFDLGVSSTDTADRDLILYEFVEAATFATMTSGTLASTNTITRSAGSFITDGVTVGCALMMFGCATATNNGLLLTPSAVTATSVTVSPAVTNETFVAGFRLLKVSLQLTTTIPLNSGNDKAIPNVTLLNHANDKSVDRIGISLAQNAGMVAAMVIAITTAKRIDVTAKAVLY